MKNFTEASLKLSDLQVHLGELKADVAKYRAEEKTLVSAFVLQASRELTCLLVRDSGHSYTHGNFLH